MLDNLKQKNTQLSIVLNNLENNFIEDYAFWKKLIDDINNGIKNFDPNSSGFTYNEFCTSFKNELQEHSNTHQDVDLSTIHQTIRQIIFVKISKKM